MRSRPLPVLGNGDGSALIRARLVSELAPRLSGELRAAKHDRMLYATDASIYQVEPLAVVIPQTREDIERTVEFCAAEALPLLPRGGGTSLAGQAVNTAVVIDFSAACGRVLEVDAKTRTARVEPGVVLDDLNRQLAEHGLMFGPDVATSSHATIGGMIGNNSAGAHSVLYGRTVEHVRALDVMLADGRRLRIDEGAAKRDAVVGDLTARVADIVRPLAAEIEARFPRTRRRVDGYNLDLMLEQLGVSTPGTFDRVNLAHLFCGAEGTLGVTLEATLDLVDAPAAKGLAIVGFRDVDDALDAVGEILTTSPAAVELLDDVIIDLARANLEYRRYVELLPPGGAVLYVEYFRDDAAAVAAAMDALVGRYGASSVVTSNRPADMTQAWKLRKAGEPLLHGQPGARKPITFIEDTAVAPERLPEFIRRLRGIVTAHGTRASFYAHASVGCLHVRPLICLTDPGDLRTMRAIMEEATDLVVEFGGALSGEHGDGRLRSHLLERFYGPRLCEGFRQVKAVFDSDGRMNPGNIVTAVPLTEQLRVRPDDAAVPVPEVDTYFRFEPEHGFREATERCNGAGVCRRRSGGTMCPSYRATLDERHATRGRGNALRLAMTGQLGDTPGEPAWNDPDTLETLDLCLSCKACKSECPSNVDLAKLKAEYLAQSYRAGARVPLAARVFGQVRHLNAAGAIAPGLANAMGRLAPARMLLNRVLGLDPRRSLPPFGRRLEPTLPVSTGGPRVVLFADCFSTFGERAVGAAALRSLSALGYTPVLPRLGCCARPLISTGQLDLATRTIRETARRLLHHVDAHAAVAVVVCEPSCLSAITDDWLDLDVGLPRADLDRLAAMTMPLEDFIEQRWSSHPTSLAAARANGTRHVLHGHCHQKALWSTDSTVRLIERVTGGAVETIDSGCCGMAGAFGYQRDHYDLSMAVGELALFPAVRDRDDAIVVAPGTSCRHQIFDGTGRHALHPIEIVDRCWSSSSDDR